MLAWQRAVLVGLSTLALAKAWVHHGSGAAHQAAVLRSVVAVDAGEAQARSGERDADEASHQRFRAFARSHFPFFAAETGDYGGRDWVFLENAGGSQVPACVAKGAHDALSVRWRVELGRRHVERARLVARCILGACGGDVVLGSSASHLLRAVADAYADSAALGAGDEVIVCEWSHEANVAPWLHAAAKAGAIVKWWRLDPRTGEPPPPESIGELLSPRTRIVAITQVSNILGTVCDVGRVTRLVRRHDGDLARGASPPGEGCAVVVDGVAWVPHRAADVDAIGCDW